MKLVLLLLGLSFSLSTFAQTESSAIICSAHDLSELKNLVFTDYEASYPTLKYRYPYVYHTANAATAKSIETDCATKRGSNVIVINAFKTCTKSCEEVSSGLFSGFGKKRKQRELIDECTQNCKDASLDLEVFVKTHGDTTYPY